MNANNLPPPTDDTEKAFIRRLLDEHEKQAHGANQLNAAELIAVREMLEGNRRWKWIASGIKTWALTITAVVAGATVGIDVLKNAIKALGR